MIKVPYKECFTYLRCRTCKDVTKHYLYGVTDDCEDQVFECDKCGSKWVYVFKRRARGDKKK